MKMKFRRRPYLPPMRQTNTLEHPRLLLFYQLADGYIILASVGYEVGSDQTQKQHSTEQLRITLSF